MKTSRPLCDPQHRSEIMKNAKLFSFFKILYRQTAVYSLIRFPTSKCLLKAILDLSNQKQKLYVT